MIIVTKGMSADTPYLWAINCLPENIATVIVFCLPLTTTDAAAAPGSPRSPSPAVDCRHRFTNLSLSQAVQTGQFWLLFFLFLAGVGACLTFLNNLGQIVVALGGAPGDQVVFVSIFAVGNAAGGTRLQPRSFLLIPRHA